MWEMEDKLAALNKELEESLQISSDSAFETHVRRRFREYLLPLGQSRFEVGQFEPSVGQVLILTLPVSLGFGASLVLGCGQESFRLQTSACHHIFGGECVALLREHDLERHVQQEISELAAQGGIVLRGDRICNFMRFFE